MIGEQNFKFVYFSKHITQLNLAFIHIIVYLNSPLHAKTSQYIVTKFVTIIVFHQTLKPIVMVLKMLFSTKILEMHKKYFQKYHIFSFSQKIAPVIVYYDFSK